MERETQLYYCLDRIKPAPTSEEMICLEIAKIICLECHVQLYNVLRVTKSSKVNPKSLFYGGFIYTRPPACPPCVSR